MMNKEIEKTYTIQEKVQKVLLYVLILAFLSGPLFVLQLDGRVGQMEVFVFGLTVVVVVLFALWLGSKMILPLFIKEEGGEDEDMFP